MRIAIDLMGGDKPPSHIYEATRELPYDFIYVADEKTAATLDGEFIIASEAVEMGEAPLFAIRRKKNSSMAVGMRLVKEKRADALISTGNTGALVASAMINLGMLHGMERPALLVIMPNGGKGSVVLDVGANITPKPSHLMSYAKMGVIYRQLMFGSESPTVGLLNIGVEERKGTKEVQQTYKMLREAFGDRFLGNIEGRSVFDGEVDVMVTDGFTGNVFLKTCEGVSSFFIEYINANFTSEGSKEIVNHFLSRYNYDKNPGAFLCGVDGIVVKCHGHSNKTALVNGIRGAATLIENKIIDKFTQAS
ncbi:MAG: Phosphate acyltransferase [Chlamydiales bacterium]|nr:Phosphate acyltransferase [Chlamydiales bacterium]MCH9620536.1 Phosphate acyltransferase [Chlamydiales bacterium]MCH9623016.1 Phosphate acyltransferase [Chlamydiales bacterium]